MLSKETNRESVKVGVGVDKITFSGLIENKVG